MSNSDFVENKILDHITKKATWAAPAGCFVALFTAAPNDAGGGTEVTGGSYARITTSAANWNTAASGSTSNAAELAFATPSGSWGTVTHFGLFDALTVGNLMRWAALTTPRAISTGDSPKFPIGALVLTED